MPLMLDDRAQISAELLIIMAAVFALALLLIQHLGSTAKTTAEKLNSSSEELLRRIESITNSM